MARPDERRFVVFKRGEVRDRVILAQFRNGLRAMVNPETGVLFTEDEIARATQPGSRYYIEADAIDLYGQASQQRAMWFADQTVPHRASSAYLAGVHQPLWLPEGKLPAVGAIGTVTAKAPAGTIWVGSTTIPDPAARVARDLTGRRYQVYQTVTTPASGTVTLTMRAIDGGAASNILVGESLTWANPPAGAEPKATVATTFLGGADAETDAEFADRIEDAMRYRPAAGNRGHFRAWARSVTAAVETAFVYANALHAGNVCVCILQKRTVAELGPYARFASFTTIGEVSSYLVPPASPVVPGNVHVLVQTPSPEDVAISLRFQLARGALGGWTDFLPWPGATDVSPVVYVSNVTSQTVFRIQTDSPPPFPLPATGANVPALMIWNKAKSRFERLQVTQVTNPLTNFYELTLASPASFTVVVGDAVSPDTDRRLQIAQSIERYMDSLGPGELVNLAADVRAHRAYRFPRPTQEYPSKVTSKLAQAVIDDLGGAVENGEVFYAQPNTPSVPASILLGPSMLTLGALGIYDVED